MRSFLDSPPSGQGLQSTHPGSRGLGRDSMASVPLHRARTQVRRGAEQRRLAEAEAQPSTPSILPSSSLSCLAVGSQRDPVSKHGTTRQAEPPLSWLWGSVYRHHSPAPTLGGRTLESRQRGEIGACLCSKRGDVTITAAFTFCAFLGAHPSLPHSHCGGGARGGSPHLTERTQGGLNAPTVSSVNSELIPCLQVPHHLASCTQKSRTPVPAALGHRQSEARVMEGSMADPRERAGQSWGRGADGARPSWELG